MFHVPEQFRVITGFMGTAPFSGNYGKFLLPVSKDGNLILHYLLCLATDGEETGWEHVSVSVKDIKFEQKPRTPFWSEMCLVKKVFWDSEDCVIQFHPPESEYVNNNHFVLHLWRQAGKNMETPPSILVGLK